MNLGWWHGPSSRIVYSYFYRSQSLLITLKDTPLTYGTAERVHTATTTLGIQGL